ncbi:MAG: bacterial Ig-like domain-containing protein, partial [Anaerovoracaceae bacterium]
SFVNKIVDKFPTAVSMSLETTRKNRRAKSFYKSLGFVKEPNIHFSKSIARNKKDESSASQTHEEHQVKETPKNENELKKEKLIEEIKARKILPVINKKLMIIASIIGVLLVTGVASALGYANWRATEIKAVEIKSLPADIQYTLGEKVDPKGLTLEVEYLNGDKETISKGYTVQASSEKVGLSTAILEYDGRKLKYEIQVLPNPPKAKVKVENVTELQGKISEGSEAEKTENIEADSVKYEYYISKSMDGKYKELKTSSKKTMSTYLDQGKTYYVKVRQIVNADGKDYASEFSKPKKVVTGTYVGPDAWRPEVRKQLKLHKVYTKAREDMIINIIDKESRGRESAISPGGTYYGLVQFGAHWAHNNGPEYFKEHQIIGAYKSDNRLNGSWSIHRLVQVIVESGDAGIRQHWPNTWH